MQKLTPMIFTQIQHNTSDKERFDNATTFYHHIIPVTSQGKSMSQLWHLSWQETVHKCDIVVCFVLELLDRCHSPCPPALVHSLSRTLSKTCCGDWSWTILLMCSNSGEHVVYYLWLIVLRDYLVQPVPSRFCKSSRPCLNWTSILKLTPTFLADRLTDSD